MNEIMETYLPLIYSNSIEFDPLINVDYTETFNRTIEGENEINGESSTSSTQNDTSSSSSSSSSTSSSSSQSQSNNNGLNISSDTPQGQVSKQDILQGNYATSTNANENTSNITDTTSVNNSGQNGTSGNSSTTISQSNENSSSSNSNSLENYTKNIKGNSGVSATAQALLKQYRDIIRGFDKEIIEELNCLFMCIY